MQDDDKARGKEDSEKTHCVASMPCWESSWGKSDFLILIYAEWSTVGELEWEGEGGLC